MFELMALAAIITTLVVVGLTLTALFWVGKVVLKLLFIPIGLVLGLVFGAICLAGGLIALVAVPVVLLVLAVLAIPLLAIACIGWCVAVVL